MVLFNASFHTKLMAPHINNTLPPAVFSSQDNQMDTTRIIILLSVSQALQGHNH